MKNKRPPVKKVQVNLDNDDFIKLQKFASKHNSDLSVLLQVIIRTSCNELDRSGAI